MGKAETNVDENRNMEKCNIQVASIHQIEEGNEKELCAWNLEQIKEESTHDCGTEMGKRKLRRKLQKGLRQKLKR